MTEGNFEIQRSDIDKAGEMQPEVLEGMQTVEEVDIEGQIRATESEIETLESQYESLDKNAPKIEALKKKVQDLKEKLLGSM